MKKAGYYFYLTGAYIGLLLLFFLNLLYVFAAIGLLTLGIVTVPSVLLGMVGAFTVITDLGTLPLLMICGGALLLGIGMCVGVFVVCPASVGVLRRFRRRAYYRRKRVFDEQREV